jgi:hypothetical protein
MMNASPILRKQEKENIGLANLRRQLELLYRDFNLSIQQDRKFIFGYFNN